MFSPKQKVARSCEKDYLMSCVLSQNIRELNNKRNAEDSHYAKFEKYFHVFTF